MGYEEYKSIREQGRDEMAMEIAVKLVQDGFNTVEKLMKYGISRDIAQKALEECSNQ